MTSPGLPLVLLSALLLAACSSPPEEFQIALVQSPGLAPVVRVSGLSSAEASALQSAALDDRAWQQLFRVTSGSDDSAPAVAGRYAVRGTTIDFQPAFPLDPGRTYRARLDPARLPRPRPRDVVTAALSLPSRAPNAPVTVTAIYPSGEEWPENLLRFYIHFSGPMARETGAGRIHIFDEAGVEVSDALLPASVDFWNPEQTRYTVLFDPGRVKRGIAPNLELGRALRSGRKYQVVIDQAWRDADGRPLSEAYRHSFRAGAARESALSLGDWRLSRPSAGSREALVVSVPAPLDRALFGRTVGVWAEGELVDGHIEVANGETEWRFTPTAAWRRTPYELTILSTLEDPAGNRIGRAFEVLSTDPAAKLEQPERFTLPVRVR